MISISRFNLRSKLRVSIFLLKLQMYVVWPVQTLQLSDRLRQFTRAGILERVQYPEIPRVKYLRKSGALEMIWSVYHANELAAEFYRKLGARKIIGLFFMKLETDAL